MKVLELFAGERCIGKAFEKKGHEVYSVEWDKSHPGCQCYQDVNNLTPEFILEQFGQPDVVWMSPDCTSFSIAAISHHRRLNPETKNLDPISDYAKFCDKTDQHCLWLISQLKPKFFFVENPRGAMRKMTWMQGLPRYTVTYCLAGETKVVTVDGERPIADLVDTTQRLLTKDGTWVDAPIRCYGTQELMKINLTRHNVTKTIYATPNHLWFTKSRGVRLVETKDLKPKMFVDGVALKPIKCKIIDSWVARGFTYGDGWVLKDQSRKHAFAMFCDEKSEMIPYFNGYCGKVYYDTHNGKKVPKVYGMPREWKTEMPTPHDSVDEIYSWLAGYFAADGSVGLTNGQLTLYSAKLKDLETVRSLCRTVGIGTYDITSYTRKGYGTEETPMYAMTIMKGDVTESFFLRKCHREKYMEHAVTKHQARRWRVVSVESTDRIEPVYCADVPNSHSFVIEGDIVTHNCKYGDTRMKPTDIWTNHPDPQFKPPCKNGDPCHEPAPRGSRTGTQGRKGSVIRPLIPEELCDHIVDICEQYIDKV